MNESACVIAAHVEKRNFLVVSRFPTRVFPISDDQHLMVGIEVIPSYAANFIEAHRSRDRKAHDPSQRDCQLRRQIGSCDNAIDFVLRRPAITFVSFPDQSQTVQRDACEIGRLRRKLDAVNRRRMRQNRFDIAEVDAECDGTGSFLRSIATELNEPLSIQLRNLQSPEATLERFEARCFRPADPLSDFREVLSMEPDEVSECSRLFARPLRRRLAAVDPALYVERRAGGETSR